MPKVGKFRYLNGDIDISDVYEKLPRAIKSIIAAAELHDRENDLGSLLADCDDIEVWTKLLVADGFITDEQWDRICARYWIYD